MADHAQYELTPGSMNLPSSKARTTQGVGRQSRVQSFLHMCISQRRQTIFNESRRTWGKYPISQQRLPI